MKLKGAFRFFNLVVEWIVLKLSNINRGNNLV